MKDINVAKLAEELTARTSDQIAEDVSAIAAEIIKLDIKNKDKLQAQTILLLHKNALERSQQFTIELLQKVVDELGKDA
ncbi:MAG: hypothetical protein ACOX6I_08530 [Syntrophomonadaceae bacterium]